MSTHNVCFHQEIRKLLCGYPLLSVAMIYTCIDDQCNASNVLLSLCCLLINDIRTLLLNCGSYFYTLLHNSGWVYVLCWMSVC